MKQFTVGDVMSREVVTVGADVGYKEIADLLVRRAISAVPVVDAAGTVIGVISEADLLPKLEYTDRAPRHPLAVRRMRTAERKASADTAAQLMSQPAVTVEESAPVSRAARLMDAARVKRLPVVDGAGRLVGIVSRRDLVRLYTRSDDQVRTSVLTEVLPALWIDTGHLDVRVRAGVVTLAGQVDRRSTASMAAGFIRALPGVVDVVDHLGYDFDDGGLPGRGWYAGHPFSAEPVDTVDSAR